jgi:putative PIN family toxin of toxin-antitoxin system
LAEAGEIHLAVSDDILNEVNRVLLRPKFGWSQDRVDAAIRQIAGFAEHVEPKQRLDMIVDDPTDNRILECAATSSSDYLVSGDNHLLRVGQYHGCKIVTPAEFLHGTPGQVEIHSQRGANASRGSFDRSSSYSDAVTVFCVNDPAAIQTSYALLNGFKTSTRNISKSRTLRVTTTSPRTRAVAAIIASSSK